MTMTKTEFIDECRFAKVVDTKDGHALLIAGNVIHLQPPNTLGVVGFSLVEALASALRNVPDSRLNSGSSFVWSGATSNTTAETN